MPRAVSRKDFLRLGGVGLTGAALLGAADCSGSPGGNKVVKFQTIAEETSLQERAAVEIQVDRFEDEHPKYALERKVILPDEASTISNANKEMQTRLQSEDSPDVFSYDTGPGFGGGYWPRQGSCVLWRTPTRARVGTSTSGPGSAPPTTAPSTVSRIKWRR